MTETALATASLFGTFGAIALYWSNTKAPLAERAFNAILSLVIIICVLCMYIMIMYEPVLPYL